MPRLLFSLRGIALSFMLWLLLALLLAALVNSTSNATWLNSLLFALPMSLVFSFAAGFSSYYLCRAYPLESDKMRSLLIILGSAALISGVLWSLLCSSFNQVLLSLQHPWAGVVMSASLKLLIAALGCMLYALAVTAQFLIAEFTRARQAESDQLQAKLMAQQAELRMLRTQIDPHFLFNSLNSISALTAINPSAAREMTLLLADFFRRSLKMEDQRKISIATEMGLIQQFLAIEKIRFGARLHVEEELAPATQNALILPMMLQPLVENAVKHGIAQMLEGGTVRIQIYQHNEQLRIKVSNSIDSDSGSSNKTGNGLGLENVRQRLALAYGHHASIHWQRDEQQFHVELRLPFQTE